MIAAGVKESY